jgi:hypothetical protein
MSAFSSLQCKCVLLGLRNHVYSVQGILSSISFEVQIALILKYLQFVGVDGLNTRISDFKRDNIKLKTIVIFIAYKIVCVFKYCQYCFIIIINKLSVKVCVLQIKMQAVRVQQKAISFRRLLRDGASSVLTLRNQCKTYSDTLFFLFFCNVK